MGVSQSIQKRHQHKRIAQQVPDSCLLNSLCALGAFVVIFVKRERIKNLSISLE
jgi:hypothetical protein